MCGGVASQIFFAWIVYFIDFVVGNLITKPGEERANDAYSWPQVCTFKNPSSSRVCLFLIPCTCELRDKKPEKIQLFVQVRLPDG